MGDEDFEKARSGGRIGGNFVRDAGFLAMRWPGVYGVVEDHL
jgi:hypothetical protein